VIAKMLKTNKLELSSAPFVAANLYDAAIEAFLPPPLGSFCFAPECATGVGQKIGLRAAWKNNFTHKSQLE
jgi:hypothetical protein